MYYYTACSDKLTSSYKTSNIVAEAHKNTAVIYHAFRSHNVGSLIHAYLTYARPFVKHDSLISSSYTEKEIHAIEAVQQRFTKCLFNFSALDYGEGLK